MKQYLLASIVLLILQSQLVFAKAKPNLSTGKLVFVENKGQVTDQNNNARNDIQFKVSAGKSLNIFIGKGQLHYQWCKSPAKPSKAEAISNFEKGSFPSASESEGVDSIYRMDVELVGANKNAELTTEDKQDYVERYFLDKGKDQGKGNCVLAKSFRKIIYKNIYPNIDWVLYIGTQSRAANHPGLRPPLLKTGGELLEYDFIVRPGGKVSDIKMKYGGATQLALNKDGSITATTPFGSVSEQAPYSYEKENGNTIASSFCLKDNILSFKVANYKGTLVIDPPLAWATYFGGSIYDWSSGVACDQNGNVFMIGYTTSTSNIATAGSYLSSYNTNNYTFLAKFDGLGNIQWATYYYGYYSGGGYWGSNRVCCDGSGNVYITGDISSTVSGLATSGAYQTSNAGAYDGYLSKFDGSGNLLWATYFGGSSNDYGSGVRCDASGNVYLTGWTESSSGIATSGAYQTSLIGTWNQYLAKFNSSGSIQWSTYYGGSCSISSSYWGGGVACDPSGNVFISGTTCATSNIATAGAYQTSLIGSWNQCLAKFNSSGSLQWGTYYGGSCSSSSYWGGGIDCDGSGNIFIGGTTCATSNVATAGAYQTSLAGSYDACLAKFNGSGSIQWATYYGGTGVEYGGSVTCNSVGDAYISGYTTSTTGIATSTTYQASLAGAEDAYFAHFDGSGNLVWATYYGGTSADGAYGLACDPADNIFMCGWSNSTANIATAGAYQTYFAGGTYDGFLVKWGSDVLFTIGAVDSVFCAGDTFHIHFITIDSFGSANVFKAQLSDSSGNFNNGVIIGTDTATTSGNIFCTIPANTIAGIHYRFRILSTSPVDSTHADTVNIKIKAKPVFSVATNSPVCEGKTLSFTTTNNYTPVTYHWSGPNAFTASTASPSRNAVVMIDSGYYYVTDTLFGCIAKDTVHVSIIPSPASAVAGSNIPCVGDTLKLTSSSSSSGVSYGWLGPVFYSSSLQNPTIPNASTSNSGTYYAIISLANGCADTISVPVTVSPITGPPQITISVSPGDTICAGGNITLTAVAANAGSPSYQWKRNGINITGATGSTLTTGTIANNDIITCKVTSNSPCQPLDTAISNSIQIHVKLIPPPSVTVTSYPVHYSNGDTVTFNGIMVGSTVGFTYQWRKNGMDIPGATASFLTTYNLNMGDLICLIVRSSVPCTIPDSTIACITLTASVNNLQTSTKNILVYPNPIGNELIIEGAQTGTLMKIYNIVGQQVYINIINNKKEKINTSGLSMGTYILELTNAEGSREIRKIVK